MISATAQHLSYARPPSVADLDVWAPIEGRRTSQARVIAHVDDKEILTVNAALEVRVARGRHTAGRHMATASQSMILRLREDGAR